MTLTSLTHQIRFPSSSDVELSQDEEWCEVLLDDDWTRIRFHDYGEIYKVLPEPELKRQAHRQIQLLDLAFGKMFDRFVQPELSPQNTQHQFMTQRAIVFAHFRIERGQQH